MKNKFNFTELQLLWLDTLEKHPERQIDSVLGVGTPENYRACCLGQAKICLLEFNGENISKAFSGIRIIDGESGDDWKVLSRSYKEFHLRDESGSLKVPFRKGIEKFSMLTEMNDGMGNVKFNWTEIAAYIRANPENVFTN